MALAHCKQHGSPWVVEGWCGDGCSRGAGKQLLQRTSGFVFSGGRLLEQRISKACHLVNDWGLHLARPSAVRLFENSNN
jgi:hypothetical protein